MSLAFCVQPDTVFVGGFESRRRHFLFFLNVSRIRLTLVFKNSCQGYRQQLTRLLASIFSSRHSTKRSLTKIEKKMKVSKKQMIFGIFWDPTWVLWLVSETKITSKYILDHSGVILTQFSCMKT